MHCERYGRRLCNVTPEELEACKAAGQNCFNCGCLHYDLDDLDFEDEDNWLSEEIPPCTGVPRPLLTRITSLRVLHSQDFDPWPLPPGTDKKIERERHGNEAFTH